MRDADLVLHRFLERGRALDVDELARRLPLRRARITHALTSLIEDGWVVDGDLNGARPGFEAYAEWAYIEHGVRSAWVAGPVAPGPHRTIPLSDTDLPAGTVTARDLRDLRQRLRRAWPDPGQWPMIISMVEHGEDMHQLRWIARCFVVGGGTTCGLGTACELLDVDDTDDQLEQRWATALEHVATTLDEAETLSQFLLQARADGRAYQAAVTRVVIDGTSPDRARELAHELRTDPRYRDAGAPESIGTSGELAIAGWLLHACGQLRAVAGEASNRGRS